MSDPWYRRFCEEYLGLPVEDVWQSHSSSMVTHWSGVEFDSYCAVNPVEHGWKIIREAILSYCAALSEEEAAARRQRFAAMRAGRQFMSDFGEWMRQRPGPWVPHIRDYDPGKRVTADQLIPGPVPQEIIARYREAAGACAAWEKWQQGHRAYIEMTRHVSYTARVVEPKFIEILLPGAG